MQIKERGKDVFEVGSESSSRVYLVTWGTEGEFWSCTCTAYAIGRNKAGGMGCKFVCKHIREIETYQPVAQTSNDGVKESLLNMIGALQAKETEPEDDDDDDLPRRVEDDSVVADLVEDDMSAAMDAAWAEINK